MAAARRRRGGFQRGRQRSLGGVVLQQAPAPPDARAPYHCRGADDGRSAVSPVPPVIGGFGKADAGEECQRGEGAAGGVGAAGARHGSGVTEDGARESARAESPESCET